MTTAVIAHPIATKLRNFARAYQLKIDDLQRPRTDNTPKRQREAMSRACDAGNLQHARTAALKLAEAHESGEEIPSCLATINTSKTLQELTRRSTDSRGYYHICLSDRLSDSGERARRLADWVKGRESAADAAERKRRAEAERIAQLERDVRFANIPGFFPTPEPLIQRVMELAEIAEHHIVLEPSAGKGDMALAAKAITPFVMAFEINRNLADIAKAKGIECGWLDFTAEKVRSEVDRVIMNPPFERGQDMEHVRLAYEWLVPGGRLVAIIGKGWTNSNTKAECFRQWVEKVQGEMFLVEHGAFERGFIQTSVACDILVVNKPL